MISKKRLICAIAVGIVVGLITAFIGDYILDKASLVRPSDIINAYIIAPFFVACVFAGAIAVWE